jgi:hypothetical protein
VLHEKLLDIGKLALPRPWQWGSPWLFTEQVGRSARIEQEFNHLSPALG